MNQPFIHPDALCESCNVGDGTRVWAFAHILPGAIIGRDCNICDHVFIENDVVLGERVTVKCGVQLWDGLRVEDDVFIGPNATFTNDKYPRSKQAMQSVPRTVLEAGASIGANATILPGVRVGTKCMVGAGAVVTKDVPPRTIVMGNPARISGSCEKINLPADQTVRYSSGEGIVKKRDGKVMSIEQCRIINLPRITDPRGNLTFVEGENHIPFPIRRVYYLYDVPGGETRGGHAHRQLEQFIIAASGSFDVVLDDGVEKKRFFLNRSYYGLYVPRMMWRELENFSSGSVCLVMASERYSESDYYRDYQEFLEAVRAHR
jgi:UDP-2-acetamido-3-amino-2,3-dideoxy-glucuronate N-acetyltransferase